MRDGHSSATPVARRLKQPTRTATRTRWGLRPHAVPIRSCSRWGLPCRFRCRKRGALLPHRFTLASAIHNAPRRSVLCGTVPGVAPAGCYPAPFVHGARTFLPGHLSVIAGAAVQPTDGIGMGSGAAPVKAGRKLGKRVTSGSGGSPSAPATSATSRHRQLRPPALAGNGAGRR